MFPRIVVFIHPIDATRHWYRVRIRKGWWGGPGVGGSGAVIHEVELELRATDERERIREALRAVADSL